MTTVFPWQPDSETPAEFIACLNWRGGFHVYDYGFRRAAELLISSLRSERHGQDALVFPVVYCLRHAVELALKEVIRTGRDLIDEPGDFPDSHSLTDLWNTCRPILVTIWPSDKGSLASLGTTIRYLDTLDPLGEGFRYPVTTKRGGTRTSSLDPELKRLDLRALFDDVTDTLTLLDGADSGIDAFLGYKAEMMAERAEMEREMREYYAEEYAWEY